MNKNGMNHEFVAGLRTAAEMAFAVAALWGTYFVLKWVLNSRPFPMSWLRGASVLVVLLFVPILNARLAKVRAERENA